MSSRHAARDGSDLRVLQVVPTLYFGGAEKLVSDLAPKLLDRVAAVEVAANLTPLEGFRGVLEEAGVPLVHVPLSGGRARTIPASVRALTRVVKEFEPDVVHAHNPAAGIASTLTRAFLPRRRPALVATYHGVRPHRLRFASETLRFCDLVIAVGPGAERQLESVMPAERLRRIDNAVLVEVRRDAADVRRELAVGERPLLVSVGRLTEEKDHRLLVDSVAALRRRGVEVAAVVVGRGRLEPDLRARARELAVDDAVVFTGARADAADLLAAADIVVHTASREGLPLVLLEALSLGKPTVAVDAIGVSDVIRDGETGRLVASRDPADVAAAVEELLRDEELRRRLAEGGRQWAAARRSHEQFVDAHVAVYAEAVARRRRGRQVWRPSLRGETRR